MWTMIRLYRVSIFLLYYKFISLANKHRLCLVFIFVLHVITFILKASWRNACLEA